MSASNDGLILITVCSACKRASCWQGENVCPQTLAALEWKNDPTTEIPGTEQRTKLELLHLALEDPSYLIPDDELGIEPAFTNEELDIRDGI